jgi:hypothetical protein
VKDDRERSVEWIPPRSISPVSLIVREGCPMLGAIAGDVIGSVHEGSGTKTKDFPLFRGCGS